MRTRLSSWFLFFPSPQCGYLPKKSNVSNYVPIRLFSRLVHCGLALLFALEVRADFTSTDSSNLHYVKVYQENSSDYLMQLLVAWQGGNNRTGSWGYPQAVYDNIKYDAYNYPFLDALNILQIRESSRYVHHRDTDFYDITLLGLLAGYDTGNNLSIASTINNGIYTNGLYSFVRQNLDVNRASTNLLTQVTNQLDLVSCNLTNLIAQTTNFLEMISYQLAPLNTFRQFHPDDYMKEMLYDENFSTYGISPGIFNLGLYLRLLDVEHLPERVIESFAGNDLYEFYYSYVWNQLTVDIGDMFYKVYATEPLTRYFTNEYMEAFSDLQDSLDRIESTLSGLDVSDDISAIRSTLSTGLQNIEDAIYSLPTNQNYSTVLTEISDSLSAVEGYTSDIFDIVTVINTSILSLDRNATNILNFLERSYDSVDDHLTSIDDNLDRLLFAATNFFAQYMDFGEQESPPGYDYPADAGYAIGLYTNESFFGELWTPDKVMQLPGLDGSEMLIGNAQTDVSNNLFASSSNPNKNFYVNFTNRFQRTFVITPLSPETVASFTFAFDFGEEETAVNVPDTDLLADLDPQFVSNCQDLINKILKLFMWMMRVFCFVAFLAKSFETFTKVTSS